MLSRNKDNSTHLRNIILFPFVKVMLYLFSWRTRWFCRVQLILIYVFCRDAITFNSEDAWCVIRKTVTNSYLFPLRQIGRMGIAKPIVLAMKKSMERKSQGKQKARKINWTKNKSMCPGRLSISCRETKLWIWQTSYNPNTHLSKPSKQTKHARTHTPYTDKKPHKTPPQQTKDNHEPVLNRQKNVDPPPTQNNNKHKCFMN